MRNREPRDIRTASPTVFLLCHSCGTRVHSADHFCRRCGLALIQPEPPRVEATAPTTRSARLRGLLAAIAVVLLIATIATSLPPPGSHAAEMAGVRIGDTVQHVQNVLGKPQKGPLTLAWKPDHDVRMWQYDLDRQAGDIPNLSVTFVDGKVWRIASLHKRYATRDGLRVGDSLAKARSLYGTGIEEDADAGLVPWKFVCGGQVVKVIVEEEGQELLAVGIETPQNFKLMAPPPWLDDSEPALPGDGDLGDRRVL